VERGWQQDEKPTLAASAGSLEVVAEWKADMNFTERPAVNAIYLFGEAQSTNEHAPEKFPRHIYTPSMGSKSAIYNLATMDRPASTEDETKHLAFRALL
jgi:hypothetical protein